MLSDSDEGTASSGGLSSLYADHGHPARQSQRSNTSGWICDPAFGMVHLQGCTTCTAYQAHCFEASRRPEEVTFQLALKDKDTQASARYTEGIEEGRRLQSQHDRTRMYRYRQERDEARAKVARQEEDIRRLRAQLLDVQDALVAVQLAYEEQVSMIGAAHGHYPIVDDFLSPRLVNARDFILHSDSGSSDAEPTGESEREIQAEDGWTHPSSFPVGSTPPFQSIPHSDHSLGYVSTEGQSQDSWDSPGPSSDSFESFESDEAPTDGSIRASTVEDIQNLLSLARDPQNPDALAQVKALCAEATGIPKCKRTPVQKYLLKSWRAPKLPPGHGKKFVKPAKPPQLSSQGSTRIPPLSSVPEIIVDASNSGIGFLLKSRWLAWKIKPGWMDSGRDIIWAELAAVELGLRTAIAMGATSTHLRVRSDNAAVITALKTRGIRRAHDKEVLQQILGLCRTYSIELMPVWIWTKVNPADAISRHKYPPRSLMVDREPEIPPHLLPFIEHLETLSGTDASS